MKGKRSRGISKAPIIFSRWRGYWDGKRRNIVYKEGGSCDYPYICENWAVYQVAVQDLYHSLEDETEALYLEMSRSCADFLAIKKKLAEPEENYNGSHGTVSRLRAQAEAERKHLLKSKEQIVKRLYEIHTMLHVLTDQTVYWERQWAYLTQRRVCAYIEGVNAALKKNVSYIDQKNTYGSSDMIDEFCQNHEKEYNLSLDIINEWKKENV